PGATASTRPGFLGLLVGLNPQGKLAVTEVAAESPAFRAGVRAGDILLGLNGAAVKDEDSFYDLLRARSLGEAIKLALSRQDRALDLQATLEPPSRPMAVGPQRAVLGIQ